MSNLYIFLAPPNGGKGTQTKRIAQLYDWPVMDMGSTFRSMSSQQDELSLLVTNLISGGNFVPDEVTFKVFLSELQKLNNPKNCILDGFPRNLNQGQFLDNIAQENNLNIFKVFYLNTPLDVAEKRASGRLYCKNNPDHIYNIHHDDFAPLSNPCGWICPEDYGVLYTREDDEPEKVKTRLARYQEVTTPLINFYMNKNLLIEIDGNQDPSIITKLIQDNLV